MIKKNSNIILYLVLFGIHLNVPLISTVDSTLNNENSQKVYTANEFGEIVAEGVFQGLMKQQKNAQFKFTWPHIKNKLLNYLDAFGLVGILGAISGYFYTKTISSVDNNLKIKSVIQAHKKTYKDLFYEYDTTNINDKKLIEFEKSIEQENNKKSIKYKSILLTGYTGTGKTYFGQYLSSKFGYTLYLAVEIIDEMEKRHIANPVDSLFKYAQKDKSSVRTIILLDELEGYSIPQFLRTLGSGNDTKYENIIFIATTNKKFIDFEPRIRNRFNQGAIDFQINTNKSLVAFKQMFTKISIEEKLLGTIFNDFFTLITKNYNKYQDTLNFIKESEQDLSYGNLYNRVPEKYKSYHKNYKNQSIELFNMIQHNYGTLLHVYSTLCQDCLLLENKIPKFDMRTLKSIAENTENKLDVNSSNNTPATILEEMKKICHPDFIQAISEIDNIESKVTTFKNNLIEFENLLKTEKNQKKAKVKSSSSSKSD